MPLRLPARGQAIDAQDVATGRSRSRHPHAREHPGRPRDRGERRGPWNRGPHERRAPCDRASPRGRQRRRRPADSGPAAALGSAVERARQEPAPAPGDGGVGADGRGGAAVGGNALGHLLRPARGHARRLRGQVRARGHSAEHPPELLALARRAGSPGADAGAALHHGDRGAVARPRCGGGADRPRRGADRALRVHRPRHRAPAHRDRGRGRAGGGDGREAHLLLPRGLGGLPARPQRRPGELHARRRRLRMGTGPDAARVLPHHGERPHGRVGARLGLRPDRPDVGGARPLCVRRLGLPDGHRREPDGHDRGPRAHERARAGGSVGLQHGCIPRGSRRSGRAPAARSARR